MFPVWSYDIKDLHLFISRIQWHIPPPLRLFILCCSFGLVQLLHEKEALISSCSTRCRTIGRHKKHRDKKSSSKLGMKKKSPPQNPVTETVELHSKQEQHLGRSLEGSVCQLDLAIQIKAQWTLKTISLTSPPLGSLREFPPHPCLV